MKLCSCLSDVISQQLLCWRWTGQRFVYQADMKLLLYLFHFWVRTFWPYSLWSFYAMFLMTSFGLRAISCFVVFQQRQRNSSYTHTHMCILVFGRWCMKKKRLLEFLNAFLWWKQQKTLCKLNILVCSCVSVYRQLWRDVYLFFESQHHTQRNQKNLSVLVRNGYES